MKTQFTKYFEIPGINQLSTKIRIFILRNKIKILTKNNKKTVNSDVEEEKEKTLHV